MKICMLICNFNIMETQTVKHQKQRSLIDFQSLKVLMSKLKKPYNLYGCSGPRARLCWCLDTNRCDNINTPHFTGPQPAKCHIYVHKDITTLRHTMAAKKKRWTVHSIPAVQWTPVCYIPPLLKTFIIRCYSKSSSWQSFPPTMNSVLYCVLWVVVATVPTPPNDEGAPFVLSAVAAPPCSIYSLSTL